MTSSKLFKQEFSVSQLFHIYMESIQKNATTGVDGVTKEKFESHLSQELILIEKKIKQNIYKFTPYKCICILRGIHKFPRVVEKPTIRDRIVLRAIYNILKVIYTENLEKRTLHSQLKKLINIIRDDRYNYILRYDVKDFYPSIIHKILLRKIRGKIRNKELIELIKKAIENTNDITKKSGAKINKMGVPQGLSIANIISNIYLFNIDKKYEIINGIEYFRFVDDILILCDKEEYQTLNDNVIKDFKKIKLSLHTNTKQYSQDINKEFDFLGYTFNKGIIGIRSKSLNKIRKSLISMLSIYKYNKNRKLDLLIFKINLRITGCIIENRKYGWMFYFSQLTDETILHSLDYFLANQFKRFGVDLKGLKKFVRSWKEINKNLHSTKYIPQFDYFTKNQKEKILKMYNVKKSAEDTDIKFLKIITKEIKNLEKDMAGLS